MFNYYIYTLGRLTLLTLLKVRIQPNIHPINIYPIKIYRIKIYRIKIYFIAIKVNVRLFNLTLWHLKTTCLRFGKKKNIDVVFEKSQQVICIHEVCRCVLPFGFQ